MAIAKRIELQNIINILQQQMPFDLVVLYGQYVNGRMRSERGGYELLLVTHHKPEKEGWELERYLNHTYAYEIREESRIHIETANINDINKIRSRSWFYLNIRNEGYLLQGESTQNFFTAKGFKSTLAYKTTRKNFDHYYNAGSTFLAAAEQAWNENQPHAAAIQFFYAALFLVRSLETTFYGNHIKTYSPRRIFKRVRHFSKALLFEFTFMESQNSEFFDELNALRPDACNDPDFTLTGKKYKYYLKRLRTLQEIVLQSGEAHIAYLERCKCGVEVNSPQE